MKRLKTLAKLSEHFLFAILVFFVGADMVKGIPTNRLKRAAQAQSPQASIQVNCPTGVVGQQYFCQLSIIGIAPPLTSCGLAYGSLPAGLSLVVTGDKKDGCAITGVPTAPTPIRLGDSPGNIIIKRA